MSAHLSNRVFLVAIMSVLLAGAWLLGKRYGASDAYAIASAQISSAEAQIMIEQLQLSLSDTEQDLKQVTRASEEAAARSLSLRELLEDQMDTNASDSADLALFRRIETTENPRSLGIESIAWTASEPSVIQLTVIQWQGRDRLTGELSISLKYEEEPALDENESSVGSGGLTVDLQPVSFDFRFFQSISVPMPGNLIDSGSGKPSLSLPQSVEVRITPTQERIKPLILHFPWSDVAQ